MYINLNIKELNRNQYTGLLNRRLISCTFIYIFIYMSLKQRFIIKYLLYKETKPKKQL